MRILPKLFKQHSQNVAHSVYVNVKIKTKKFMDYYVLQFNALKFFLGVRLHGGGGSQPNFNFLNVDSKFFNEIVKFTSQIA